MVQPIKILLVEDEEMLRDVYVEVLQDAGYQVDVATEGDTALEKATQGGYELILMDVMLPNKDGIQVIRDLQTKPPIKPNKKIVFMTNLSKDSVLQKVKQFGIKDVIVKNNLTPDEFLKKVQEHL